MSSPRSWAFSLLGIYEYQKKFNDDRLAKTIERQLLDKLVFRYTETAAEDWPWFENTLSYDNAVLAHVLIRSGDKQLVDMGLNYCAGSSTCKPLRTGIFSLLGRMVSIRKGQPRAYFDQQPLEAQSTLSACLAAFEVTGEANWHRTAIRIFKWFTGYNDLGLPLYDQQTGGCRDGLHIDRVNQNQGAESSLSYLLALAELYTTQKQQPDAKSVNVAMPAMMNG